jgi:hypothetical protein
MAYTARTHGDLKQVANFDTPDYTVGSVDAVTSAVTVQPQGPKLDYCTITSEVGHLTGAEVNAIIQTLTQLATVHIYEFTTGGTYDSLAVAFYPTQAWGADVTATGAGTLDAAVTAVAGAVAITASATFTN